MPSYKRSNTWLYSILQISLINNRKKMCSIEWSKMYDYINDKDAILKNIPHVNTTLMN